MTNYVLAYTGGGMASTDAEREAAMAAWGAWFGSLGSAIVDAGNPFGPSMTVASGGAVSEGGNSELTGYTVVQAEDLASAGELAKGCPVLSNGGTVEVYETFSVM
ncbi:MAG TPA: hypothetical protein VKG62_04540 [Solirubrobacteraceae bacterium]|nr:hypothetical protein [Solirubrobacteraceae bacterium]